MEAKKLVLWFNELELDDIPQVGGKNASLGEMIRELTGKGVSIPDGFAVTAEAYRYLLDSAGIGDEIEQVLSDLDTHDMHNLSEKGEKARSLIYNAPFPDDLNQAIIEAYGKLCDEYGEDTDVAVRSSATAEDLPDASFAGQQETYLNITGKDALLDACRKCFASLFTNRAISYREDKGFDHMSVALSIGVQKMVRSDLAASGVIFSI
ncbi:MAG: phosphoenolpyruvate synthase, partial [Deltaproteobacteria bacterium]|nr:phosphoenolpyruvate synthase [Deltaproteobacteria bacterium]